MKAKRPHNTLLDTGFWIAYFNEGDAYHKQALLLSELVFETNLILPWPTLYEFLNTRFSRRKQWLRTLDRITSEYAVTYLEDSPYREGIVADFLLNNLRGGTHSLTDLILRQVLQDVNVKVRYFVTFNRKDFADVCAAKRIEILAD